MTADNDTVFAPASGTARAAVNVIRVSGPRALSGLGLLTGKTEPPPPRKAVLRSLTNPDDKRLIDRPLVLCFPGPESFTGEDVVEYHLHGGPAVTQSMLACLGALAGHRMAEPGEFTRRAFENGKIDLTSAEAINDLVMAETEAQQSQALDQMDGVLARLYEDWRSRLVKSAAYLEATIDFADEDLPEDEIYSQVQPGIKSLHNEISAHIDDNRRGEILRDGIKIAIIGEPNAGKSSLVNALARRDAAITSEIAGTTRDIIEIHLNLGGYPVIIGDTAGLRPGSLGDDAQDRIESEGIRRALEFARQADLKILLFDGARLPEIHQPTLDLAGPGDCLVINKTDLDINVPDTVGGVAPIPISTLEGSGLDILTDTVKTRIESLLGRQSGPSPTRARHRQYLSRALEALDNALDAAEKPPELLAEDLRVAARAIGQITGSVDVENLLDVIFRDFCIGK